MGQWNAHGDLDSEPWYRYGWTWFLISVPRVSIGLGFTMLYLGLSTNNSLVVDDYYKAGKAINLRIARDVRATQYGLQSEVFQMSEGVVLTLSHAVAAADPATAAELTPDGLRVRFVHVTQAHHDTSLVARHIGGGRYLAVGARMPDSDRWRIHVAPEPGDDGAGTWRLVSREVSLLPTVRVQVNALPAT